MVMNSMVTRGIFDVLFTAFSMAFLKAFSSSKINLYLLIL